MKKVSQFVRRNIKSYWQSLTTITKSALVRYRIPLCQQIVPCQVLRLNSSFYLILFINSVSVNYFVHVHKSIVLLCRDIRRHCRLSQMVVDSDCYIPEGTVIGADAAEDVARFYRNAEGTIVVTKNMIETLSK